MTTTLADNSNIPLAKPPERDGKAMAPGCSGLTAVGIEGIRGCFFVATGIELLWEDEGCSSAHWMPSLIGLGGVEWHRRIPIRDVLAPSLADKERGSVAPG